MGQYKFDRIGARGSPHQDFAVLLAETFQWFGRYRSRHLPESVRTGRLRGREKLFRLHSYLSWGVYHECPGWVKTTLIDSQAPLAGTEADPVVLVRWKRFG